MTSRVVVLGGCGAYPEPGRACSGFLLEHAGFRLVLDLGYGTFARLLAVLGSTTAAGLDAVVVTHDHPDHVVDLHALFRARLYDGRGLPRIALYAPAAVAERVAGLEDAERPLVERAGAYAAAAGARRLMLTHFWPGNDRDRARAAAAAFAGEILVADEGTIVPLP